MVSGERPTETRQSPTRRQCGRVGAKRYAVLREFDRSFPVSSALMLYPVSLKGTLRLNTFFARRDQYRRRRRRRSTALCPRKPLLDQNKGPARAAQNQADLTGFPYFPSWDDGSTALNRIAAEPRVRGLSHPYR